MIIIVTIVKIIISILVLYIYDCYIFKLLGDYPKDFLREVGWTAPNRNPSRGNLPPNLYPGSDNESSEDEEFGEVNALFGSQSLEEQDTTDPEDNQEVVESEEEELENKNEDETK